MSRDWPQEFWQAFGGMSEGFENPRAAGVPQPGTVIDGSSIDTSNASPEGEPIPPDWEQDFAAAARRPLRTRLRYAFVHTYKPVMDDAPYRSFSSLAEYREWCARNLPSWLGYGPSL
jgi:hypothetical protein